MAPEDSPGTDIAFVLAELIRPQRVIRYLVTAMLLYFAYRETGGATVACLALTAIAIELTDALTRWNNKVVEFKHRELEIRIMGMTTIFENAVAKMNQKKGAENVGNETGVKRD